MSRRSAFAVVLALAGCGHEAPPSPVVTQPSPATAADLRPEPPRTAATASAPPATSAAAPAPEPPRFTQIELSTTQGDLTPLLADEFKRAKAKGLVPVVEFYADWCPPCQLLHRNMRSPEVMEGLAGAHLIKLNMDDWHDKLPGTGFAPKTIPSFYLLTADGKPSGKMLDGDRWATRPKGTKLDDPAWSKAALLKVSAAFKAFLASP